jgi:hypothetical protein
MPSCPTAPCIARRALQERRPGCTACATARVLPDRERPPPTVFAVAKRTLSKHHRQRKCSFPRTRPGPRGESRNVHEPGNIMSGPYQAQLSDPRPRNQRTARFDPPPSGRRGASRAAAPGHPRPRGSADERRSSALEWMEEGYYRILESVVSSPRPIGIPQGLCRATPQHPQIREAPPTAVEPGALGFTELTTSGSATCRNRNC